MKSQKWYSFRPTIKGISSVSFSRENNSFLFSSYGGEIFSIWADSLALNMFLWGKTIKVYTTKSINSMSSREAMTLPDYFVPSCLEGIDQHIIELIHHSLSSLVIDAENLNNPLKCRFAAGVLLGLMKNPRINIFDPCMIDVPSSQAQIGISLEDIGRVLSEYKYLGLKREWILKEVPRFTINIPNFKLGKYLVTNMEYKVFLEDTQYSGLPTSWEFGIYPFSRANQPVYTLLPEDAEAYIHWLSYKTGRSFRLPTEYEWEYAASGNEHYEFPWGNKYQQDCANTLESKIWQSTPVGIFPKGFSPFGCADMAGNVEEYVSNNYFVYPGGFPVTDDLGGISTYRITRGGSFSRHIDLARCSRRHGYYDKDIYLMGFRLAEQPSA